MRGLFVTGTGTGVGKSVVSAALLHLLATQGMRAAGFKPAVTGLDEDPGPFGYDHELLAACSTVGQSPEDVAPYRYREPVSPHYAAKRQGEAIDPAGLQAAARTQAARGDALVCEGVGGLMVPLRCDYRIIDFACDLGLAVVVAAGTQLGTINHTALTVSCARAVGLEVAAVVLTPWPAEPSPLELSNRETIEALCAVKTQTLALTRPSELQTASSSLSLSV